jgi:hypothetical protein
MQLSDRIFFVVASWPLKAANHKFDESNTWIKGLSSLNYGAADVEQCFANPADHVLNIPGRIEDGDEAYICFRIGGRGRYIENIRNTDSAGNGGKRIKNSFRTKCNVVAWHTPKANISYLP